VKKLLLAGFAVSALIAPAVAADMPVPAAPVATWAGFYLGVNAGYALNLNNSVNSVGVPNNCTDFAVAGCAGISPSGIPTNSYSLAAAQAATFSTPRGHNGGFIGGGQFGYNWQPSTRAVVGLEADLQAVTGSSHSVTRASVTQVPNFGFPINQTATVSTKLDYIGTIRARAGYLWTPDFLLYVTAGLAYGESQLSSNITQNVANPPNFFPYNGAVTNKDMRFGGAVGAGVEWMFARSWSLRAEYLYVGLDTRDTTGANSSLANVDRINGGFLSSMTVLTTAHFSESIARGAVNYHF
jgi:outer membrane immunogenic protein